MAVSERALNRLETLIYGGSASQLKQALVEIKQPERLINYPIPRYNGRTTLHLAASKGLFDFLELLLKYGGEYGQLKQPSLGPGSYCTGERS